MYQQTASVARQVCKDKVPAPSDLVRAEVEMLRGLEHPAIPQASKGKIGKFPLPCNGSMKYMERKV